MARVPTATVYRDTAVVTVNETDLPQWEDQGFKRADSPAAARDAINAAEKAKAQAKADSDAKADADAKKLADEEAAKAKADAKAKPGRVEK